MLCAHCLSLSVSLSAYTRQTARRYNIPGSIIARAEALSLAFDQLCRGRAPQREAETSDAAVVRDAGGLSDNEGAWWPSNGGGWSDGPGGAKGMEDAAEVSYM